MSLQGRERRAGVLTAEHLGDETLRLRHDDQLGAAVRIAVGHHQGPHLWPDFVPSPRSRGRGCGPHLGRGRRAGPRLNEAGDRTLDACCGTGDLAIEARAHGADVVGLDFSERMLELARKKAPEIEFVQGAKSYHPAAQELERAYIAGHLAHGGDPVLQWSASNIVMRRDENNNMAPSKKPNASVSASVI